MIDLKITGGMFVNECVSLLVDAVKELQTLVGDLRIRVAELEGDRKIRQTWSDAMIRAAGAGGPKKETE